MSELIAIASLIAATGLVYISLSKLIDAKFNALYATTLGMGGLVLIDIGKYYYLDSKRIAWVGDGIYQEVALLIWLSCLVIFFTYFLFIRLVASERKRYVYTKKARLNINLLKVILLPLSAVFSMLNDGSGHLSIVGGIIKGLIVALFIYGLIEKDRVAIFVSIVSLLIGVDDSSRRAYIAIFLPAIFIFIYIIRAKHGEITVGRKILAGLFLLFFFVFLNAIRSTNDFGEGFDPEHRVNNTIHYITHLTSIDTFYNTAFLVERFPDPWDYYYGETYLSILVAPIPRSLWPDKPVSLGAPLGLMNRYGYRGKFDNSLWEDANQFSLSPGFVGEAYANFGYIGVLVISSLLGFAMALFDKKIIAGGITPRTIPWLMFLSTFLVLHRGDFYVSVNYPIFMFLGGSLFFRLTYTRTLIVKQ